jgi:acetyl-CoA synthetase
VWESDEPGQGRSISYYELSLQVNRIANLMKHVGVRKGDVVTLYMPMIPELAMAMLACTRIGAIHSVVFAGFSAESLRDRIVDCHSRYDIG